MPAVRADLKCKACGASIKVVVNLDEVSINGTTRRTIRKVKRIRKPGGDNVQLDKIRGSEEIIEEQHQADLQVMVVQQAEIKKLKEQNNKMLERLKMRVAYLVKHDFLSCNHIDEENELRNLIEKIEGGK